MAHNKLYRNFIILQEDENNHSNSADKPLSGYAKIEAKSDKCKISFYAQNLKKDEKYTIVLICYKKEVKQIIDLGKLEVNEVGKGEAIKEYYINDIAGLNLSYEKISGAAICKHKNEQLSFLMYGFMNNENIKEDWKKCKVVKSYDEDKPTEYKKLVKKESKDKDDCKKEEYKKEVKDKKDHKHDDNKECKDDYKEDKKYYKHDDDKECKDDHKEDKKDHKHDECKDDYHDHDGDKHHKDDDKKDDDKDCKEDHDHDKYDKHKEDYGCDENCKRGDELEDTEAEAEVDESITQKDFDEYEENINKLRDNQEIDPYDFRLKGAIGDFFDNIVKGFEEVKGKFKEIKYCKWYKIKISSIDDMCNTADYNKYTVAYYPMLNYYPYIKKYGYFFIGYKCDSKGNLKYIVYGIPGNKDKDEQPYVGKTGFVTWIGSDDGKVGCWLMFYDYKNSNIVVPMK